MSKFHEEQKHKAMALIFESQNIEQHYRKANFELPIFILDEKKEKRLCSVLESMESFHDSFRENMSHSVHIVSLPRTLEQLVNQHMGFERPKPQGFHVCAGCLAESISILKEELTALEDMQAMLKEYEDKIK